MRAVDRVICAEVEKSFSAQEGIELALADVTRLIPPPAHPNEVGTLDEWRMVEQELNLTLPADYREFVFTYGTGMFAVEYSVYNPFWGGEYLDRVRRVCEIETDFRVEFPHRVPHPVWPESGGVFPWADDQNGNTYFWLTDGHPDQWQVVTNEPRGRGYREHHCSMTDYLAGVLRGEIVPLIGDFPSSEVMVFLPG